MTEKIHKIQLLVDHCKKQKSDRDEKFEKMKEALKDVFLYAEFSAQAKKAMYDAYIKEGFTPQQAIELCKQ